MKRWDSVTLDQLVEQLRVLAAKLPGAEQYVMVHHPAFRVGKKPFAIAGLNQDDEGDAKLSVNLGRDMQHQLLDDARFSRTPYIGQHGWVSISRSRLPHDELSMLVTESWRRVANPKQLAALSGSPAHASETAPSSSARTADKKTAAKTAIAKTSIAKKSIAKKTVAKKSAAGKPKRS